MSASPPVAVKHWRYSETPLRAICDLMHCNEKLLDHLVSDGEHARRNSEAKRLGGLEIDHQVQFRGLQYGQIGRFRTLEDFSGVDANLPISVGQAGAITHQTTDRAVLAQFIDCRERVAGCYPHELLVPAGEEGVGSDENCVHPTLHHCCKRLVYLALAACS